MKNLRKLALFYIFKNLLVTNLVEDDLIFLSDPAFNSLLCCLGWSTWGKSCNTLTCTGMSICTDFSDFYIYSLWKLHKDSSGSFLKVSCNVPPENISIEFSRSIGLSCILNGSSAHACLSNIRFSSFGKYWFIKFSTFSWQQCIWLENIKQNHIY